MHIIELPYESSTPKTFRRPHAAGENAAKIRLRVLMGIPVMMVGRNNNQSTPPPLIRGKTTL
jgi:hypothetical protein